MKVYKINPNDKIKADDVLKKRFEPVWSDNNLVVSEMYEDEVFDMLSDAGIDFK